VLSGKPERMEKTDPTNSSKPRYSNNMTNLLVKKKEKLVARILATKFHTKPVEEPRTYKEVRLNPIIKDLIINKYEYENHMQDVKRKRSK
jgi:hypothetical protein